MNLLIALKFGVKIKAFLSSNNTKSKPQVLATFSSKLDFHAKKSSKQSSKRFPETKGITLHFGRMHTSKKHAHQKFWVSRIVHKLKIELVIRITTGNCFKDSLNRMCRGKEPTPRNLCVTPK
jgi:hypothetical protein